MSPSDVLSVLLKSYQGYYDVRTGDVEPPFVAEAAFHSHDEQYFLVKSARLSEAESHEYAFFATGEDLTLEDVQKLDEAAWQRGTSRANPHGSHRSTDVVLIILGRRIAPEAMDYIKRVKHYQSYRFTFHGWSHYRAVALETSTGTLSCNRRGQDLKKLFRNIHFERGES